MPNCDMHLKFPEEEYEALRQIADDRGQSMTTFVRRAVMREILADRQRQAEWAAQARSNQQ